MPCSASELNQKMFANVSTKGTFLDPKLELTVGLVQGLTGCQTDTLEFGRNRI